MPLTTERATFLGPSSYTCFVEHSDANTLSTHHTVDQCVRNHAMRNLEYWYIYMAKSAAPESLLGFSMQVKSYLMTMYSNWIVKVVHICYIFTTFFIYKIGILGNRRIVLRRSFSTLNTISRNNEQLEGA